ncbi:hypothetical protein ACFLYD_04095 [Chloroflexota bacterium]
MAVEHSARGGRTVGARLGERAGLAWLAERIRAPAQGLGIGSAKTMTHAPQVAVAAPASTQSSAWPGPHWAVARADPWK